MTEENPDKSRVEENVVVLRPVQGVPLVPELIKRFDRFMKGPMCHTSRPGYLRLSE